MDTDWGPFYDRRMPVCQRCGEDNPERARFCLGCGAPLAAPVSAWREERKRVSVLFCDLVGFTSRSERLDVEDVRGVLAPYYQRLRSELERFGGTVEKFIGDAVMALFGAPVAHEDDPERAVRAALAIRDAMAEFNQHDPDLDLHVRVGVTTGEALVGLDARPVEGEGMASGDVVNTAARLQAGAPVDGILVDETTFRATDRQIAYQPADPVTAKGKTNPVPAWRALGPRASLGVDVDQTPQIALVGRERERDLLTDALARARAEQAPQLVTLIGVPGIGKSRLVWELGELVEADPELITWRQGRCLPYGEGVALWALGEIVKAQAGILDTDPADAATSRLTQAVADLIGDEREAAWVLEHLGVLIGVGGGELGGDRRAEAFAAWRRFVEALAEQGPAVLVFEDLHWADALLLDFLDHLVDWAADVPLLIVATARPELLSRRPGWGGGKPNSSIVSLAPLSEQDTAQLVATLLGQALLPAELQAALLARAGGNPLYAEEYVRMLADRGFLKRAGGNWRPGPNGTGERPSGSRHWPPIEPRTAPSCSPTTGPRPSSTPGRPVRTPPGWPTGPAWHCGTPGTGPWSLTPSPPPPAGIRPPWSCGRPLTWSGRGCCCGSARPASTPSRPVVSCSNRLATACWPRVIGRAPPTPSGCLRCCCRARDGGATA